MSPVVTLALSLMLISLVLTRVVFAGKWLNPITALFAPHMLLLISYQLALDGGLISFELSSTAWVMLSTGYLCYAVGVVAVYVLAPYPVYQNRRRVLDLVEAGDFHRTTVLLVVVLFLGIALKYFKILTTYGNPLTNIIQIRHDYVTEVLDFGLANSVSFFSSFLIMMN
jgi:hypothetical protein